MTRLEPFDSSETCSSKCKPQAQGSKSTSKRHYDSSSFNSFSFSDIVSNPMKLQFGDLYSECETGKSDLPTGLCSDYDLCVQNAEACTESMIKKYAGEIILRGRVPMATGNTDIDSNLAIATVLLNLGFVGNAISHFTRIIEEHPQTLAAYHGRALGYARSGIQIGNNAEMALKDLETAIKIDKNFPETYERRSEILISLGRYVEAAQDLEKALQITKSNRLFSTWGLIHFMQRNFVLAEENFKKSLDSLKTPQPNIMYHLGLSQLHRGKIRNAIEVFREVLKMEPNNVDALFSISQSFKEIGDLKKATEYFNKSLTLEPANLVGRQLRASMYYGAGLPRLALQDAEACLSVEPSAHTCQYIKGMSHAAMGHYYPGIKSLTKLILDSNQLPIMKATPEYIKAQYLKEYSRYLHANLETPIDDFNMDTSLNGGFRDSWAKGESFDFTSNYREQPGLQPSIDDVTTPAELSDDVKSLVCKAEQLGSLTQVNLDGVLPNQRLNLAMGLAVIHVAQMFESYFLPTLNNKPKGNKTFKSFGWREIFNVAVRYRRLVDPEQAVFWLDMMPKQSVSDGFKADVSFIKGQAVNVKLNMYFELIFKLLKTMLEHYNNDGIADYEGMKDDLQKAKDCQDLLKIARKRKMNHQGFMVTTQVPSIIESKNRLEGTTIMLTEPEADQINLVLTTASTRSRTKSYHKELEFLFNKLQATMEEPPKNGQKNLDFDTLQNLVLNMLYVFLNLMPLSRGTSSVGYATIMGLFLAMGKEVQGKIPQGKLVDMEALLSGAPDAFSLVTKQWMTFKKSTFQPSSLPKITDVLPTVRSILELLNIERLDCSKKNV